MGLGGVSGAIEGLAEDVGCPAEGEREEEAVPRVEDFVSGGPVADGDDGDAGDPGEGEDARLDAVFGTLRAVGSENAVHAAVDSRDERLECG